MQELTYTPMQELTVNIDRLAVYTNARVNSITVNIDRPTV